MDKQQKIIQKTQSFLADRELALYEELQETNDTLEEVEESLELVRETLSGAKIDSTESYFTDDEVKEMAERVAKQINISDYVDNDKLTYFKGKVEEFVRNSLKQIKLSPAADTPVKGADYYTDNEKEELKKDLVKTISKELPKYEDIESLKLRLSRLEQYELDEEEEEPIKAEEIQGLAEYINVIVSKYVGVISSLNQGQNKGGIWSGSANPFVVFDQNGALVGRDIRSVKFTGNAVTSVTNNNGDITVTLTAGSGGSGGGLFAIQTVSGTINGSNTAFTISTSFSGKSFIDLNGQLLVQDTDYTVSGTTVTYTTAPAADLSGATHKLYYGVASNQTEVIKLKFDGMGSALTVGTKNRAYIGYACTITGVVMLADVVGSVVLDIWKDTYANYPATIADTITASAKPTISAAIKSKDTTLTGWTTTLAADDEIVANVDSCSSITWLELSLIVTRT